MTQAEQDAFRMIVGGLQLLAKAVKAGDPHAELDVRVSDLIRDVEAIAWPDLNHGPDVHALPRKYTPPKRRWRRAYLPNVN